MIKTNFDYQTHDCNNNMHNQPDNCTEVWCEMLDSSSCSVDFPLESDSAHFNLLDGLR